MTTIHFSHYTYILTNTIWGDQVVNVPATTASTIHMTRVNTAGKILPDMLNSHLSEVFYQEDEDLLPDGN